MLVVGWVGWGPNLHPTRLSPDEQYTHISLWCLLAAPLLIGCDLTRLDTFTLNLLTQRRSSRRQPGPARPAGRPSVKAGDIQVWVKEIGGRGAGRRRFQPRPGGRVLHAGIQDGRAQVGSSWLRDLWRQEKISRPTKGKSTSAFPPTAWCCLNCSSEREEKDS